MSGDGGYCTMGGTENRYHTLRAKLDGLGFRQPLAIECMPLVEALLGDLLHTTASLQHYKKLAHDSVEKVRLLEGGVQPYRADNSRLVKQNGELHLEVIRLKEDADKANRELKARCRKLESDNSDLQFLVSQHLSRIRSLENESADKSKKLIQLQAAPSVTIGRKKCSPGLRTTFEVTTSVGAPKKHPPGQPWLEVFANAVTQTKDPFIVNMAERSQAEVRACRQEMKVLKDECEKLNDTISTLQDKLHTRDIEVARLNAMLESGRHLVVQNDGGSAKEHEYTVANLRSAVNTLEQSNDNLRTQLKDAIRKQHEAMVRAVRLAERNQVLESQLRDVDNVAMRVEDTCNFTVRETSQKVTKLQEELTQYQKRVAELERGAVEARCNAQNLLLDIERLRLENKQLVQAQRRPASRAQSQSEKEEVARFQKIEQDLTMEIERLVSAVTYQKRKIAELEEKIASSVPESPASPRVVAGSGVANGGIKTSSNSSSARSSTAPKKQQVTKKVGIQVTGPKRLGTREESGRGRSVSKSTAIQTEDRRIESKEVQVNLTRDHTRHEPPERDSTRHRGKRKDDQDREGDRQYWDYESSEEREKRERCTGSDRVQSKSQDQSSVRDKKSSLERDGKEDDRRKEKRKDMRKDDEYTWSQERHSERDHFDSDENEEHWRHRERRSRHRDEDLEPNRQRHPQRVDKGIQHNGPVELSGLLHGGGNGAGDGPWNTQVRKPVVQKASACEDNPSELTSSGKGNIRLPSDYAHYIQAFKRQKLLDRKSII